MLGGIHLGMEADLCMAAAPGVCLLETWQFLPGKASLPFLTIITKDSTHDIGI